MNVIVCYSSQLFVFILTINDKMHIQTEVMLSWHILVVQ